MEKTVNFDLTGKVAIVTGGSRGLGVELATSMAEYGADKVILVDDPELETYRTEPYAHALAEVIKKY